MTGPYGCVGVLALRLLGCFGCSLNNFCSSFGCVSVTVPSSLYVADVDAQERVHLGIEISNERNLLYVTDTQIGLLGEKYSLALIENSAFNAYNSAITNLM